MSEPTNEESNPSTPASAFDGAESEDMELPRWKALPPRRQAEPPDPPPGAASVIAAVTRQRIIADRKEPRRLAELYLDEHRMHGVPAIVRWAGSWWRFGAGRFCLFDEEQFRANLWQVLDRVDVEELTKEGDLECVPLAVKGHLVSDVADALRSVVSSLQGPAPQWIDRTFRDPDPVHLVPCKNGILDLRERELLPMTARMFATTMVNAPWLKSPQPCPQWLNFLNQLWGDDTETIQTLQEMFGYLLTTDTSQQKIFALIGTMRSGKGTIARVLRALLGEEAVVNPTLSGIDERFGLAPLIGKSLAVFGDARIGAQTDQAKIVERLLSLSGEDALTIEMKFRDAVTVRLRTRVLLLSNNVPRLYDPSGALMSRFVVVRLRRSFLGREDTTLEGKLLTELPGIFQWAVAGWESLRARGRFLQPAASADTLEDLEAMSAPHLLFVREMCVVGPDQLVSVQDLYERWKTWCDASGREAGNRERFGVELKAAFPDITVVQRQRADGKRHRAYRGIGLA